MYDTVVLIGEGSYESVKKRGREDQHFLLEEEISVDMRREVEKGTGGPETLRDSKRESRR